MVRGTNFGETIGGMTDPLHTIQKWCSLMTPSDIQRISAIVFNTLSAESQLITYVSTTHLTNFKIAVWRHARLVQVIMELNEYSGYSCLRCSKTQETVVHQQLVTSAKFLPDRLRHFVLKEVTESSAHALHFDHGSDHEIAITRRDHEKYFYLQLGVGCGELFC